MIISFCWVYWQAIRYTVAKGGLEEQRFWMFFVVLPVASQAASRSSAFLVVR